ncbi:hypothetical protein [Halomonas sp. TD01]|uniref:hypothetical protein n=1 Tax=Halomonas sp. TD01 TaxID=999141 RepID=UPI000214E289|nr:hypothetical protein [Halomonas sp. TD01]EGP20384.1 hypothetical protein GME_06699 [Halomonas sp. TD01]CAH1041532.1 hypothetical protein HPTD01_10 [Halomonas sp. TD01]
MDDSLDKIQADLEAVLDRLENHLIGYDDSNEEMAVVLYSYIIGGRAKKGSRQLGGSILLNDTVQRAQQSSQDFFNEEYGNEKEDLKGHIVAALSEVDRARSMRVPLSRWAIETLACASDRYVRKIDRYLGEFGAKDLAIHKGRGEVKPNFDKIRAALFMIYHWCSEDPEQNKLSRKAVHGNVFERAEKMFNVGQATLEKEWRESAYPSTLLMHRSSQKE